MTLKQRFDEDKQFVMVDPETGEEFPVAVRDLDVSEHLTVPSYDDMANADAELSSIAISMGQTPHGPWWHNGRQWVGGRTKSFSIQQASLGGNDVNVHDVLDMPPDKEIDLWEAHIGIIDEGTGDVYLDIYDADADEVLFEHGHDEHGNTIVTIEDGDECRRKSWRSTRTQPSNSGQETTAAARSPSRAISNGASRRHSNRVRPSYD